MKKKKIVILTSIMILLLTMPVLATNLYKGYKVANLNINGKNVKGDVPAIIMDGRTLVPLRLVGQTLGADVQWDNRSMTAKVSMDNKNIDSQEVSLENDILNYRILVERLIHLERSNIQILHKSVSDLFRAELYYDMDDTFDTYQFFDSITDGIEDDIYIIRDNFDFMAKVIKDIKKQETNISNKILGDDNKNFEAIKNISDSLLKSHNQVKKELDQFESIFDAYTYSDDGLNRDKLNKNIDKISSIGSSIMRNMDEVMLVK